MGAAALATPLAARGALAADLAMSLDPVRLSQAAGITPDPWQAQVLRSSAPRLLLNCSRQSGKSTTVGTLAMHTALYVPHALVLIVSPSKRQSEELFRKCLHLYRALGRPSAGGVGGRAAPRTGERITHRGATGQVRIPSAPSAG